MMMTTISPLRAASAAVTAAAPISEAIMIATALRAGGGITHGWKAIKRITDTE